MSRFPHYLLLLLLLPLLFVQLSTKPCLSLTPNPTLLTLPNLASASATLSTKAFSALLIPLGGCKSSATKVSTLLAISCWSEAERFARELLSVPFSLSGEATEVLVIASAILTLMQWVGLLQRFHKNVPTDPGIGVVMSGSVYLKLTGKTRVLGGAVRRLGPSGRIPFPLVVVHSGNTTTARLGFSASMVWRLTKQAWGCGFSCGGRNARSIAWNKVIGCTRRVEG